MNSKRRELMKYALGAFGATGLAASYATRAATAGSSDAAPTPAAQESLAVGVLRNVPGSLIVVANEKGMFKGKGLDVSLPGKFLSGGGPELLPAVAAGNVDLGMIGDTPVILALGRGDLALDVVSVVSDTSRVFSIVAGQDLHSVHDLAGKRVGLPLGTAFQYFLARSLENFGMKADDVELVNLTQAQAQPAFVSRRIDAVLPDTFGRTAILKARPDAKVLFSSDTGFASSGGSKPFRQYNVFITRAQHAKAHAMGKFLRTYYQDVTTYLTSAATQGQALGLMADFLNGAVKGAVTVDDLRNQVTLSGFPTLDEARRSQQKELRGALEVQAQFWLRAGKIKNQPDFGKMMDASLLA